MGGQADWGVAAQAAGAAERAAKVVGVAAVERVARGRWEKLDLMAAAAEAAAGVAVAARGGLVQICRSTLRACQVVPPIARRCAKCHCERQWQGNCCVESP